jgi:hypothetical protein
MEILEAFVLQHCVNEDVAGLGEPHLSFTEAPAVFAIQVRVEDQVHFILFGFHFLIPFLK